MATNNKINISDLDFDLIKANLKEFMKGQDQFSDYDFDGSALSVLIDLLAYNTHYNALYTNLAINEMFLDSASKRDSVISIANNYGYLPTSYVAARAKIGISIPVGSNTASTMSLAKYTPFTSSVAGKDYTFYTINESIGVRDTNSSNFVFNDIMLCEGTPVIEKFNVLDTSKIILKNAKIDVTTIKVTVQNSASLTSTAYKLADGVLTLDSSSEVYFIREVEGEQYEIFFGKDNLGKEPSIGSVVTIEYIVTSGLNANGIRLFTYAGPSLGTTPVITVSQIATGGRDIETVDEIKYNVSHKYKVQNRAVTASDYADIIKTNYDDIDSINVWGGESMTPPIYGKIYISIKPKSSLFLTSSEKNYILESIVKPKSIVGVSPVMVDPIYNTVQIETTVYYNPNLTNKSSYEVQQLVRQAIINYDNTVLQKFDGILRYSRLIRDVDDADKSIINNITTIQIRRILDVLFNTSSAYTSQLNNAIYQSGVPEESVYTTGFYIDNSDVIHHIDDDGVGNLRLFYYNTLDYSKVFVNAKIGTVNYATGELKLTSLFVTRLAESDFEFIIKPQSNDIMSKHNQIVTIDPNRITVNIVQETLGHVPASSRT
jgi:hypothetical protein